MKPDDRLICLFVKDDASRVRFKEWPLHLTIVPWFRLDTPSQVLAQEITKELHGIGAFPVVMAEATQFGYKKSKSVNLVAPPSLLFEIEKRVRATLKRHHAWLVDETTKKRKRVYRPHVTAQKNDRLQAGDVFWCHKLSIVTQRGEYKEITAEIGLGHDKK
jgi:2'-5' RNA ligase